MKYNYEAKRAAFIGSGAVSGLLGLIELFQPSAHRPTGKWVAITGPLYDHFGSSGIALAFIVLGAALIALGLMISKDEE